MLYTSIIVVTKKIVACESIQLALAFLRLVVFIAKLEEEEKEVNSRKIKK